MTTVLYAGQALELPDARADGDALWIPQDQVGRLGVYMRGTTFRHGDAKTTAPSEQAAAFLADNAVNLATYWERLGRPVLHSEVGDVWSLGTAAAETGASLQSLQAPDFTLPDVDGTPHTLSDLRGRKIFLVSWASW